MKKNVGLLFFTIFILLNLYNGKIYPTLALVGAPFENVNITYIKDELVQMLISHKVEIFPIYSWLNNKDLINSLKQSSGLIVPSFQTNDQNLQIVYYNFTVKLLNIAKNIKNYPVFLLGDSSNYLLSYISNKQIDKFEISNLDEPGFYEFTLNNLEFLNNFDKKQNKKIAYIDSKAGFKLSNFRASKILNEHITITSVVKNQNNELLSSFKYNKHPFYGFLFCPESIPYSKLTGIIKYEPSLILFNQKLFNFIINLSISSNPIYKLGKYSKYNFFENKAKNSNGKLYYELNFESFEPKLLQQPSPSFSIVENPQSFTTKKKHFDRRKFVY